MPVTHTAHFTTEADATLAARALEVLLQEYAEYEHSVTLQSSTAPYGDTAKANEIPPPLLAFAARHGFAWPSDCGFLLRGPASDVQLIQIDRLVLLLGNGFELGGKAIRSCLLRRGALFHTEAPNLVVQTESPSARLDALTAFLDDEDLQGDYVLLKSLRDDAELIFAITFQRDQERRVIGFRHRGMETEAFVAALYQLSGEDPIVQSLR